MKKTKSVLYDISPLSPHLLSFYREYDNLVKYIIDGAKGFKDSCSIHIDYGAYELLDYDEFGYTFYPNMHVVVAATDTTEAEQLIEKAIAQNQHYNEFKKYSTDENALTVSNTKILDELGFKQDIIKVTYGKSKKRILIASQTSYEL